MPGVQLHYIFATKKFSSGRTRTEKVVTSVFAQYSIDAVDASLKSFEENDIAYFGVATDGSNHNELKLFPLIIEYFEWRKGGLQHIDSSILFQRYVL